MPERNPRCVTLSFFLQILPFNYLKTEKTCDCFAKGMCQFLKTFCFSSNNMTLVTLNRDRRERDLLVSFTNHKIRNSPAWFITEHHTFQSELRKLLRCLQNLSKNQKVLLSSLELAISSMMCLTNTFSVQNTHLDSC